MLVELLFVAQNFQCGASAPLAEFNIIIDNQTLEVGDSVLVERGHLDNYEVVPAANADCINLNYFKEVTGETLPDFPGLFEQPAIRSYTDTLSDSESVILWEFGHRNGDWQDVVLRVDYDPFSTPPVLYAD